jgi:hypothetical protein
VRVLMLTLPSARSLACIPVRSLAGIMVRVLVLASSSARS